MVSFEPMRFVKAIIRRGFPYGRDQRYPVPSLRSGFRLRAHTPAKRLNFARPHLARQRGLGSGGSE